MTHAVLGGSEAPEDKRLDERESGFPARRVPRQALPLQRCVDEVNRSERVLLGDEPTLHRLVEDPDQELAHDSGVVVQVGGVLSGHLPAHRHAGLHVVAADHLQVRPDVDAQGHERIGFGLKALGEHPGKLLGHAAHVGQQQHLFVRKMIVDRRAPNARPRGDLAQGDRLEGLFTQEGTQRLEQARAG